MWLSVGTSSIFPLAFSQQRHAFLTFAEYAECRRKTSSFSFHESSIDSKHTIPYHPPRATPPPYNSNWWKKAYANSSNFSLCFFLFHVDEPYPNIFLVFFSCCKFQLIIIISCKYDYKKKSVGNCGSYTIASRCGKWLSINKFIKWYILLKCMFTLGG